MKKLEQKVWMKRRKGKITDLNFLFMLIKHYFEERFCVRMCVKIPLSPSLSISIFISPNVALCCLCN